MATDVEQVPVTVEAQTRPRRLRRWLLVLFAVVLLAAVALAVWGAVEAGRLAAAAREARTAQAALVADVRAQDWAAAQADVRALQEAATRTEQAASSLPFAVAARLPVVGDDVGAVRTVASAVDDVARGAVEPLVTTAESLATGAGGLDLPALVAAAPRAQSAADVARAAQEQVGAVDAAGLVGALRPRVVEVQEGLTELATATDTVARAATLLPPMLGSPVPRTHLLVFQNLAEARPTGGIFGSWALVTADHGRLALAGTGSIEDLGTVVEGLAVPAEVQALYGADLGYVANVNLTPDFPTAAGLLSQTLEQQGLPGPDSVIAVDPVALAAVLDVTGPVQVAGTAVDSGNAVDLLLNEAYTTFDGRTEERKAYLQLVTGAVFGALLDPSADLVAVGRALAEGTVRDHVLVWSRETAEQQSLESFGLTHGLPEPSDRVTVHLTNADGSKLDYFLRTAVSSTCTASTSTVQVDLTNTAPESVPDYVGSKVDDEPTTHRMVVTLLVPAGRTVTSLTVDGQPVAFAVGTEGGWTVVRGQVDVPRDRTVPVVAGLVGGSGPLDVAVGQPLVAPPEVRSSGACS